PRIPVAGNADEDRRRNADRHELGDRRQTSELALRTSHDHLTPRKAERPALVDAMDDVVPALADELHGPLGQRQKLRANQPRRALLVNVLGGCPGVHYAEPMARGGYVMQLGRVAYNEAWELQRALAGAVSQGAIPDTIILLEHPPVVTLGRRTDETELHVPENASVEIGEADRGGKSTFHGPGQLVCYPILDLKRHGRDVKQYVRNLEEALIRTVEPFGLTGERIDGLTGVWLTRPPRKLASI